MNSIHLHNNQTASTAIPNRFFDDYMPKANGEFVKVYLYLLRCISDSSIALSINGIADKLNHTETDVIRALRYWEQVKLLTLTYNGGNQITAITLCDYANLENTIPAEKSELPKDMDSSKQDKLLSAESAYSSIASIVPAAAAKQPDSELSNVPLEPSIPQKHIYSDIELLQFQQNDDISQILYVAQRYLGKTLNSTETNTILYFYDSLHFPADLIEYLIEYCVSKNHKNMHYIEKVALAWAEQEINTVEAAKSIAVFYNKTCFAIMKAFGLSNRNPGESELTYIKKWSKSYAFPLDIILEACDRTIQSIHQPSFEYADSILTKWKTSGIKSLQDIQALDQAHMQAKELRAEKTTPIPPRPSTNKFNNITPRSYLYDDLEKQLLNH